MSEVWSAGAPLLHPCLAWFIAHHHVFLVCPAILSTPAQGDPDFRTGPAKSISLVSLLQEVEKTLPLRGGVWVHFPSILPAWKGLPGLLRKMGTPTHCIAPCEQQKKLTITH